MDALSTVEENVAPAAIDEVLSRRLGRRRFVLALREPYADVALSDLMELAKQHGARVTRGPA